MSQEGRQISPSVRGKSPSRIPVLTSSAKKRPANVLVETPRSFVSGNSRLQQDKPLASPLKGFRRLEALAKADVRNRNTSPRQIIASKTATPWVEKHLPQSIEDLFVHKKKVEEVITWMTDVFKSRNIQGKNICVVNGPAGCGKTAAVYLVAKKLEADVKEWTNPMSLTQYKQFGNDDFRDEVQGRSQLDLFADFLFRTSQYRSLPIKGKSAKKNRIILVEDIPNMFYRDTTVFHNVLRKYSITGQTPLVFIFTDSAASEHSMYKMFPKSILTELRINNISMNPVASTLMVKFLLEICTRESIPVSRSQVDEIAATANGDLRCAVNNLQFSLTREKCATSTSTFRKPAVSKKSRKQDHGATGTEISQVQHKDDTIQLFRALGKVLYGKRDESLINQTELELVGEMEKERRIHPLLENPENICDKMEVSAETFLNFLHQNYPAFFGSMDDMRNAAEYLGDGDFILSSWKFDDSGCKAFKVRDVKERVAMSTTIRGLMHANNNRVSVGWKPLTKPLVSNLESVTRDSVESTRQALFHLRELQTTLFTEAIPFYAKLLKMKPSSHTAHLNVAESKEIIDRGLFQQKLTRVMPLDEKETVEENDKVVDQGEADDSQGTSENVETQGDRKKRTDLDRNANSDNSDEEFIIEEFE